MGPRTVLRVFAEALFAGTVSVVVMLWIVSLFGTRRRQAAEAMLLAGVAGVAVFVCVMALLRWREIAGRRAQQLL
jgi:ABC-type nickel/cobalt efflux system permease component RcnA